MRVYSRAGKGADHFLVDKLCEEPSVSCVPFVVLCTDAGKIV